MAEQKQFRLEQGMSVVDRDGNAIGKIDSVVIEDREGRGVFLTVDKHLLPMDALIGVEEDKVKVALNEEKVKQLPEHRPGQSPSPQDIARACEIAGLPPPSGKFNG